MPGEKPNLDLISMVQRARAMHDASARPSDLAAVYWIEAKAQGRDQPQPTANAGEWRVSLSAETVDAVWERVKRQTRAGQLGYKSKVSTAPAAGQSDPQDRMLCARTYDAGDAADVQRVKSGLLRLGLVPLAYVPDRA